MRNGKILRNRDNEKERPGLVPGRSSVYVRVGL